jgi:hypothetical protein
MAASFNTEQQKSIIRDKLKRADDDPNVRLSDLLANVSVDVLSSQEYRRYQYRVQLLLSMPDESRELPGNESPLGEYPDPFDASRYLEMISEINNYRTACMPIYQLQLMVPDHLRRRIIASSNKSYESRLRVYVKIWRIEVGTDEGGIDASEPADRVTAKEELVYDAFELRPYDVPQSAANTLHRPDDVRAMFQMTLSCFAVNDMIGTKLCRSHVFEYTTVTGAIIKLMMDFYGTDKEFLIIAQPDNTREYEDIIIPPMSIYESMQYLQEVYGVYESGMVCYSNRSGVHVLPIGGAKTHQPLEEVEPLEGILIYIKSPDEAVTNVGTRKIWEDQELEAGELLSIDYLLSADSVAAEARDDSTRELSGEIIKVIGSSIGNRDIKYGTFLTVKPSNVDEIQQATQQNDPVRKRERVFVDRYGDKYSVTRLQSDAVMRAQMVVVSLQDIDGFFIQPNIAIRLVYQNPELNALHGGLYNVASKRLVLTPVERPGIYSTFTQIELRRIAQIVS